MSNYFLFAIAAQTRCRVEAVGRVSSETRIELNTSVLFRSMSQLDVLNWDGVDGLDGDNLDDGSSRDFSDGYFDDGSLGWWASRGLSRRTSWGLGRGLSWCLSCGDRTSSGGLLLGLDSGITNDAVAFIVSDVGYNVLDTIGTGESKKWIQNQNSVSNLKLSCSFW